MARRFKFMIGFWLLLIVGTFHANPQAKSQTTLNSEYWLNIGSCPLKINVNESGSPFTSLFLENTAQSAIIDYQLGCVVEENGVIKIKAEKPVEKIEIKSSATTDNILYLPKSSHGNYLSSICSQPYKVAIINLNFADGGTWTLKR